MARISTYPIISTPTVDDLLIGTDVNDLNITKNFTIGEIGQLIGQDYVPYVGATGNVNLGSFNITSGGFIVGGGTAGQFLKANGTLDSTVYTPQTRTLTINGTTYNLSANRSWDLNTIDTLTTTGTSGAATYIGKVLNIPVYQAQGAYITQLSGEATAVGPGNASVTLSNSAVIGKVLTGLNVTGGSVVSTDTILQAFGKVQNQINGLAGGVEYQGVWNAATNNPFLQSSVGTKGYYYVVSVAGNTNLNGITDWQVGDWAIYNGTTWDKVDNTDAVVSVNGYVGAVVLTSSDVGAVPTTRTLTINGVGYNLSLDRAWTVGDVRTDGSYANPSWITSLAWSKITGTPTTLAGYGITDGALNTRTLTINGTTYDLTANRTWNVGTVTSVGTSGPLTGGTITGSGTIGITQAGASSDGYLSSADWNAFNSKQEVISVTAPITFAAGVIGITQSSSTVNGYLSSTDWTTFNSKVSGSGTANTLPMWGSASSLINSPLSYAADTFNFQYNSATGGTVVFTNSNGTAYAYTIQMNNFGSPRSTIHSYTDGLIIQSIGGTQVSRMFANGNLILGTGTVDNGYKLEITGNLYVNTIANATVDTDRFIVSDGGVIKYRTGAEILADIGAVSSVGLTMPAAFTVSNSPITSSGTIGVTAAGTTAQYIRGDGTLADFPTTGGGGSSVSYYLNGSVNQGTFGGNTYYEMSKTPILGAGTDFSIGSNGYIAQFITDAGDPNLLEIPGGNWNLEFYFSASSGGGTPNFYVELYKYDGTTFTLIASNSTSPELIAFGTTINPYFSSLAVSQTSLLATDRLAIRIYVNHSGRTITLHTENGHLCQIITTFTTGLTALNGLTKQVQYFSVGSSGTDFNISSSVATHTFNLPTASATNRGALSSADWTTFNSKIGGTLATGQVAFGTAANTVGGDNGLFWDNTNKRLAINITSASVALEVAGTGASGVIRSLRTTGAGVLSVGDHAGRISLGTSSGSAAFIGAQIGIIADATWTAGTSQPSSFIISTVATASTTLTERWRITSTGILQSNGAQTIQTSTGDLTLATAGGNGSINLVPNGTGGVGINTNTPLGTLDIRVAGNGGSASNASNSIIISPLSISDITEGEIGSQIILNARRNGVSDGVSIASVMQTANFDLASMAFYTHGTSPGTPRVESMRIFGASGNLLLQNGGTFTDAGFRLDVNGTARVQGATTITGSTTAASAIARGANITSTLVAAANNDVLVGLDVSPTFTNGAFTGVSNFAARINGSLRNINASSTIAASFGGQGASPSVVGIGTVNSGALPFIQGFNNALSGTASLSINPSGGNVVIGAATDAGFRLDVNGTTRLNGLQTFQGTTASDTAPLGSELATTGSGTNWTGTDFATGYTHVVGSTAALTTSLAAVVGTYYQITYTVTGRTAGSFTINYGGTSTTGLTATGAVGPLATSTANLDIVPTTDFNGTIILSVRTIGTSSATTTFRDSSGNARIEIRANNFNSNIFIGLDAGRRNTTGISNTGIGLSLFNNTTGNNNTGIGFDSLSQNTTGNNNIGIGLRSLRLNTTASDNNAIGVNSLSSNTTGSQNNAFGYFSMLVNTTGGSNTAYGNRSLQQNLTASNNTAVGERALQLNDTGAENTAVGSASLLSNTTGSQNIAIGSAAGRYITGLAANTISNNSIYIGWRASAAADNQTNQIVIGHNATGLGSNTTVIGNSSTTFGRWFGSLLLGTSTNVASSIFTMSSTTQGFLPPRMTASQRTAIASPAEGLVVFQIDSVIGLYIYANATWRSLTMV